MECPRTPSSTWSVCRSLTKYARVSSPTLTSRITPTSKEISDKLCFSDCVTLILHKTCLPQNTYRYRHWRKNRFICRTVRNSSHNSGRRNDSIFQIRTKHLYYRTHKEHAPQPLLNQVAVPVEGTSIPTAFTRHQ